MPTCLKGLLIAQDNIDEVIQIIRESYDDAQENLMNRFGLSDVQAQAILDMQLKRLQGLEKRSWRQATLNWRNAPPTITSFWLMSPCSGAC